MVIQQAFTPASVRAMEQGIRDLSRALIAGIAPKGEADFMKDFASRLPTGVFLQIADLPDKDDATDDGDDRVTLRLQPKDRVEIIFHRGAKRRTDAFEFVDPYGLIEWAAPDRGVVAVPDPAFIEQHRAALTELVAAWIVAAR